MKKRMLSSTMALLLVGAMALPVHAEYKSTTVSYIKENSYEVNIPATLDLESGKEKTLSIGMNSMDVEPTKQAEVKVKSGISNGKVTLKRKDAEEDTTTSTVSLTMGGHGIGDNEVVATFKDQNKTAESGGTLYFTGLNNDLKAGTWTGTIVFEASIVNSN